jgi:hypothetical protein
VGEVRPQSRWLVAAAVVADDGDDGDVGVDGQTMTMTTTKILKDFHLKKKLRELASLASHPRQGLPDFLVQHTNAGRIIPNRNKNVHKIDQLFLKI